MDVYEVRWTALNCRERETALSFTFASNGRETVSRDVHVDSRNAINWRNHVRKIKSVQNEDQMIASPIWVCFVLLIVNIWIILLWKVGFFTAKSAFTKVRSRSQCNSTPAHRRIVKLIENFARIRSWSNVRSITITITLRPTYVCARFLLFHHRHQSSSTTRRIYRMLASY